MFGWFKKQQRVADPAEAAAACAAEGRSLQELGDVDGALQLLQKAEALARPLGESALPLLQGILITQAQLLHQRDDLVRAAVLYEEASHLVLDPATVMHCLENLAEIGSRVANLERTLELHRRHHWDWRGEGNPNELCATLANQAVALAAAGKRAEALLLFEKVEQVCRELPSHAGLAITLGHQADIHAAQGDPGRAFSLFREQEQIYESLGNAEGVARSQAAQRRVDVLGPSSAGVPSPQAASARIALFGGQVECEENRADRPVVAVNLRGCRIKDEDLAVLPCLDQLEQLELGDNSIGDAALAHVAPLHNLKTLILQQTQITDQGMEHLQGLTQLQVLFLGGTRITDRALARLRGLTQLQVLILGGTGVTDAGLPELKGLPSLWNLDLRQTQITDAGLNCLGEMKQLKKINLIGTQVTGQGIERLRSELPEANEIYG